MKVLAFADLHGHGKTAIEKAKESGWFDIADHLVLLGDIPQEELRVICDNATEAHLYGNDSILGILGNHDWYDTYEGFPVVQLGQKKEPILKGAYVTSTESLDSLDWFGMSGAPRYKTGDYAMLTQEEASEILDNAPRADILVTHDGGWHWFEKDDAHCGFKAISKYIKKHRPKWHIFGHQHITSEFRIKSLMNSNETHCVCVYGAALIDLETHDIEFFDLYYNS